jgi:hypothetical protein
MDCSQNIVTVTLRSTVTQLPMGTPCVLHFLGGGVPFLHFSIDTTSAAHLLVFSIAAMPCQLVRVPSSGG